MQSSLFWEKEAKCIIHSLLTHINKPYQQTLTFSNQ